MLTVIALSAIAVVSAVQVGEFKAFERPALDAKFVAVHNKKNLSWKASTEQGPFFEKATLKEAKVLMGAILDVPKEHRLPEKTEGWTTPRAQLPSSFDSRAQWPHCPTIRRIRDQSACGSCWAFSSTEAMSDRECIAGGHRNLTVSVQQMNSCCHSCGYGCDGGFPPAAWRYWMNNGLATEECDPYSLPGCDHHIPGSHNPCPTKEYSTPPCVEGHCTGTNGGQWKKFYGKSAYEITSGPQAIMQEIMDHGPVQTAFTVYADFLTYKSGVYQHTSGQALGGHAVKIIGWGVENGQDYWLIANSWNAHWGDNGFFKILRGVNECGIENQISAGEPQ